MESDSIFAAKTEKRLQKWKLDSIFAAKMEKRLQTHGSCESDPFCDVNFSML